MNTKTETEQSAYDQAKAHLDSICEMVLALGQAQTDEEREEAIDAIMADLLSLEVRSGWHQPTDDSTPEQYRLLLATGGPACQIVGELNEHGEPISATIQGQDWGTPWIDLYVTDEQQESLMSYVGNFVFTA